MCQTIRLGLTWVMLLWALSIVGQSAWAQQGHDPKQVSSAALLLSNSHSWAPMSFIKGGQAQGMLVDFWRMYEEVNGQPVAFRLVDWGDSIEAVRNGDAHVHAGLLKSPERESFLLFTKPIFPLVTGLFAKLNKRDEALAAMLPIGVISQSYEAEFMLTAHPEADFVFFDNSRELVQAAHEGVIDAFVLDLPTGMYFIREFGGEGDVAFIKAAYSKPIHAAVSRNNPGLLAEIQAGIDRIPKERIRALVERKFSPVSPSHNSISELPWLLLKAFIFLLFLALIWWAVKGLLGFGRPK